MEDNKDKYNTQVKTILPNTKRTLAIRKKLEEEENKRRAQAERVLRAKQEEQKKYQQELEELHRQQQLEQEKKNEEQRRKEEEQQTINTLKGTFGNMINNLKMDDTPLEYTISGLSLLPAQIRIFVQATIINQTLKNLSMTRKDIKDVEGNEIMKFLIENKTLEKLELEGNLLGVKTAEQLGNVLKYNQCLRHIDMEGNNLTDNYSDNSGIQSLAQGLAGNQTLLYMNLCNCNLDFESGKLLREAVESNDVIINIDLTQNPKLNLYDVRAIQDKLNKNKKKYDKIRFDEFLERKRMKREEQISSTNQMNEEFKLLSKETIEAKIQARKRIMEEEWTKQLYEEEIKRQKEIAKKEKETRDRLSKKGKKKKGKKGKK